jgi:hypothetical protein
MDSCQLCKAARLTLPHTHMLHLPVPAVTALKYAMVRHGSEHTQLGPSMYWACIMIPHHAAADGHACRGTCVQHVDRWLLLTSPISSRSQALTSIVLPSIHTGSLSSNWFTISAVQEYLATKSVTFQVPCDVLSAIASSIGLHASCHNHISQAGRTLRHS